MSFSIAHPSRCEVHIFSDASKAAIAAVAYVKVFSKTDKHDLRFLLGKGKVAPTHVYTIPQLKLCAVVMTVDQADTISEQLDFKKDAFHFYTAA